MEKDVPIVVVKGVGKSYGTVEALKEVSFVVERGEIFGLVLTVPVRVPYSVF